MKLLLDTNILLDCMMDRQPFAADAASCSSWARSARSICG